VICDKQQFAKLCGMSKSQILIWIEQGMPCLTMIKARAGGGFKHQIDTTQAIPWLLRQYKTRQKQRPVADMVKHEQARRLAINNATSEGLLVKTVEVESWLSESFAALANELEGLPGRLSNEFAGISDPARIRTRLLAECRRVRVNFSRAIRLEEESGTDQPPNGGNSDASADETGVAVGGREEKTTRRKRGTRRLEKQSSTVDH
jgi:phage terminase Nu1 subunit (DNA packaging protein)